MNVGKRIKERRIHLGLSAEDVAEKLNINRATVYRYESSYIEKLPVTIIEPLARVLKTTPAYLMGWTDTETQKKNDIISDIILRLRTDENFLAVVTDLYNISEEQLVAVKSMLKAFKE